MPRVVKLRSPGATIARTDLHTKQLSAVLAANLHLQGNRFNPATHIPLMSMQANLIEPSDLPQLPQPGPIEHWLFEQPLLPAAVLVFIALATVYFMRHRKQFKALGLPIALVCLFAGVGVYLLGSLTVTDRELLRLRSNELVQSVANADNASLRALLDENARLSSIFASAQGADRIVELTNTRNRGVVRTAEVGKVNAGLYGPQVATTQIRVRTEGDMFPSLSWWRVDWTRESETSDDWVVTHIEPIWIQGFSNPAPSN